MGFGADGVQKLSTRNIVRAHDITLETRRILHPALLVLAITGVSGAGLTQPGETSKTAEGEAVLKEERPPAPEALPPAAEEREAGSDRSAAEGPGSTQRDAPSQPAASSVIEIRRPEPIATSVDYPADAEGSAQVVLQFVVDTDGSVRDVEVLVGDEPFASAAVDATRRWRFTPAQRGERVVPAKIRFEVSFTQVQEPSAPPADTPLPGQPAPDASPVPAPVVRGTAQARVEESVEVTVEGERPPGAVSLTRAEGRQVPGALGDPLRAVETLPGVTPTVSGLPLYYVRGAPPANVGNFIDEVRVPLLYHAFLGPSVIHPELMERVTLYPGPYPASHGRFAGAIVAADLRTPRREFGYRAEVGIFDSGGYVETPFAGGRGNLFFGGRYSYLGALVSAFSPNSLEFWNYQTLIEYELTPKDTLGVFALGAFDYLEGTTEEFFGTEFHRVDLRYTRDFSADTTLRLGATVGLDRTRWSDGNLVDEMIAGRMRFEHRLSPELQWRSGMSFNVDRFDLELDSRSADFVDLRDLFRSRGDSAYGGFTDFVWRPVPGVSVTPGVRVDLFQSGAEEEVGVDPRLSARFSITDGVETVHGVGISHQPPNYVPNVPGARVAGLSGGLQTAVHTSSGVEAKLPYDLSGTASVFQNAIFDVTDPFSSTQSFAINAEEAQTRPLARSYGVELSLRRPLTRRFGGLMSYTLSRSTRTYPEATSVAGSDRTHVLNLAGMYTFGPNWRLGARSVFYTGVPGRLHARWRIFDQGRAPAFFRGDLRLERVFRFAGDGYLSVVAELLNATFSAEAIRRVCFEDGTCDDDFIGPIFLPNLKVEARF